MARRSHPRTALAWLALAAMELGCARSTSAPAHRLDAESYPVELRAVAAEIEPIYTAYPDDASVLYQLAALQARAGRRDDAIATLRRMAAAESGVDPRARDGFQSLVDDPEYRALVAAIRAANPPVRRATVRHVLDEADLVPEGIAWSTQTRRLYLGSAKGKIISIADDGIPTRFGPPGPDSLGIVGGLRVDDARGELWAAASHGGRPAVYRLRLTTGERLGVYDMPYRINDVAVAPDGMVYGTGTDSNAVVAIDRDRAPTQILVRGPTIGSPNGIAASPDGRFLFVATWHGIVRVDRQTRAMVRLAQSRRIASGCLDGLYLEREDAIIGVQNCVHSTGRVLRFTLNAARDSIERADVLESYNPLFESITTAAVAGDTLFFVANVQFRKMGTSNPFSPLQVLSLPLQ
jgi:sugar lactone lactonase YvrE